MSRYWTPAALAAVSGLLQASSARAAEKPNVLIIMADDCTHTDLPIYGGRNARTPTIDRLASGGLTFDRAYLAEAMCQPCRSELYTGLYPMRNGCAWNHSASRPSVTSMPHHLRKLGYRVGLAGKVHVRPAKVYPFDKVPGFDPNCGRQRTRKHDLGPAREFMVRDGGPFCLVIALVEPHVPWTMGDASRYPVNELELPPHIADTPRTRRDFAAYLAEITYMDRQVGDILKVLEASGRAADTLVLFTSEQGAQFPGCKWTNYDAGVHTALVARWPGRIAPSARTGALVQYADVLPTLMDIAGAEVAPGTLDGTSFRAVLSGESRTHREYVFGVHNNVPEGPPYPIRSITDGTYHYLRNLTPDSKYYEKHLMGQGRLNNPYWATWVKSAETDERTARLVKRYTERPREELFRLSDDRHEMENLAGDPEHEPARARLSKALDEWLRSQGDPGVPQDTREAHQAAVKGRHKYCPPE
ncbi:MAG: sulfatase family protein [Planctomycetota bacterium]|jgi:uncharacterized sulfatase